jgi:hypothetical protein
MTKFETERTATILLNDCTFLVRYKLAGKCSYTPGNYGGPPEDCYPEESDSDITETEILHVIDEETGKVGADAALKTALSAELRKLPLEDYLFESWMQRGGDSPHARDDS